MNERLIERFWDSHPCGEELIGGLSSAHRQDYEDFFDRYDAFKYELESHIPGCLDDLHLAGKRVLEIGLGQGAESEQILRRGGMWSGLDLSWESVSRVRARLALRGLEAEVRQGSVLEIPWLSETFDLVFSHGVLHHVPEIQAAQAEIRRVLKPGGELVVMLYARHSINYQISIKVLRRALMLLAYPFVCLGWRPQGLVASHIRNARAAGLARYLRIDRFLSANTDGPDNPFSRVYDLSDVRRDFPDFEIIEAHQHFMHAPPLPLHGLSGGSRWGWHLWVLLRPR